MRDFKVVIVFSLFVIFFVSCTKHETLPDLETRSFPPPPPRVYPYGGNSMVKLDSFTIQPWGTTTSFVLTNYVSVNAYILAQYATKYTKIMVYDGTTTYGSLPYPNKTFGKVCKTADRFLNIIFL